MRMGFNIVEDTEKLIVGFYQAAAPVIMFQITEPCFI